jgi:DGQHR domain-containing protein
MISIQGLAFRQRQNEVSPEFLLFSCTASELLIWCDIDRLESRPGGQQRKKSDSKIRSIKRFFDNPRNTIPTAVVVSVKLPMGFSREDLGNDVIRVSFALNEGESKPGLIIDGQHRLLGMLECDEALKISITAILTSDENEPAFQFLIINNKAARVSTDHVKSILAEQQDDELTLRLRAARLSVGNRFVFVDNADNDKDSPFNGMIDWPSNRTGLHIVKPAAIEASIKSIQEIGPKRFEDSDNVIEFFFEIWKVIRSEWQDLFSAESALLSKVGIICMTQFMASSLVALSDLGQLDLGDIEAITRQVRGILNFQAKDFWRYNWPARGYDTKSGHKAIFDSLTQIGRNLRAGVAWNEDVTIVSEDDLNED